MIPDIEDIPDLSKDLVNTKWIVEKVRTDEEYAKSLYAAMCNTEWQKLEVMSILKGTRWSCSWRKAGRIISTLLNKGNYLDWYCSGNEGIVTDFIAEDLKKIGWVPYNQ